MFDREAPRVKLPRNWQPKPGWQDCFRKREPQQQISWVTRTPGCMVFTFKDGVTRDQRIQIEAFLRRTDYEDYVKNVTWSKEGNLVVNLKAPRRFIDDPNVRKNARNDMPVIVQDAYTAAIGQ